MLLLLILCYSRPGTDNSVPFQMHPCFSSDMQLQLHPKEDRFFHLWHGLIYVVKLTVFIIFIPWHWIWAAFDCIIDSIDTCFVAIVNRCCTHQCELKNDRSTIFLQIDGWIIMKLFPLMSAGVSAAAVFSASAAVVMVFTMVITLYVRVKVKVS